VETDCTGDFSCEKTIEKTILRVLGSSEFSHSLDGNGVCIAALMLICVGSEEQS
jgi:hypothetical protein